MTRASHAKQPTRTESVTDPRPSAGPHGAAMAPPDYGIAFVDREASFASRVPPGTNPTEAATLRQPVVVQAKLRVGGAGDPAEREADAIAAEVLASMRARDTGTDRGEATGGDRDTGRWSGPSVSPGVRRSASPGGPGSGVVVGLQGGDIGGDLARTVRQPAAGSALDSGIRPRLERAFGASFDRVRVHRESALAPQIGARAFTYGNHVHFAPGAYQPDRDDGLRLIGHELTHVVQQTGGAASSDGPASRVAQTAPLVQRDIGFEFETRNILTKRGNGGPQPAAGFANGVAGAAAFNDPNATRIAKGGVLLQRADIEVQADDCPTGSDLEVVTTHFPETPNGRVRLDNAMADLWTLVQAHGPFQVQGGGYVPARALRNVANFTCPMRDAMTLGNWIAATTAPQVTLGLRLRNVSNLVQDLHGDPNEILADKATRDPGRLRMRRPDPLNAAQPRATLGTEETDTLVNGWQLAVNTIQAYQGNHNAAPGGPGLEGFMTILFSYTESMQHKQSFLKNHTPLMAKTDLAATWSTLPLAVRNYYAATGLFGGKTRLERLVETAPGYAARMDQPLFHGVNTLQEDNMPLGANQWYHRLSLRSWLRKIARNAQDRLTTANFPHIPANQQVEGYGALGGNMDVDVNTGTQLPVFELRSANRPITYQDARQWSLDMFDYIVSLNANPGGGYQHIV